MRYFKSEGVLFRSADTGIPVHWEIFRSNGTWERYADAWDAASNSVEISAEEAEAFMSEFATAA